jgi:hypothetical protein
MKACVSTVSRGAVFATLVLGGCDYSGDWLFPTPDERVPGVIDLGRLEPTTIAKLTEEFPEVDEEQVAYIDEALGQVRSAVRYAEVGATGSARIGGVTFSFVGTGESVCIWVDPETVYWSQSVARQGRLSWFSYPDNPDDDGDIDLYAGRSVYYSGTPGAEIGNFTVRYQDALGNEIPVQFNECLITSGEYPNGGAHSGRAAPEFCTLASTARGDEYTVVLETWAPPRDDNRLGYGLLFVTGDCDQFDELLGNNGVQNDECLITGESIRPDVDHDYREEPILSLGQAGTEGLIWDRSIEFEQRFCEAVNSASESLLNFCEDEAAEISDRRDCQDGDSRCFCGDLADTPTGGSF